MNANELMIGDWVKTNQCYSRIAGLRGVEEIKFEDKFGYGFTPEVEPIPITKEILEKNGLKPFEIDKLTDKATAKWWCKNGDYYIKQYNFRHNNFEPTYSFGCHPFTLIEGIRYVHELQHALRLCNIKRDILL